MVTVHDIILDSIVSLRQSIPAPPPHSLYQKLELRYLVGLMAFFHFHVLLLSLTHCRDT